MKIDRTPQGILLEHLLHGMKHRYTLCWNGSDGGVWGSYDCGCCITYLPEDPKEFTCGCICHERIEAMANGGRSDIRMFLLAFNSSPEKPFFAHSYEHMMKHYREIWTEHEKWRLNEHAQKATDCCEACKLVTKQDLRAIEHKKDPKNLCSGGDPRKCFICTDAKRAAKKRKKSWH